MRILVDADACHVKKNIEQVAKEKNIEVIFFCDTNHEITSDYGKVVTVAQGRDAADFKIVNTCKKGDIVITQDYGLAALVLSKKAYCINQYGKSYTNENIDSMLMARHIDKRNRAKGIRRKGCKQKKKTNRSGGGFNQALTSLIDQKREYVFA